MPLQTPPRHTAPQRLAFWLLAFLLAASSLLAFQAGAQIRLKTGSGAAATVDTPRVRAELVAQATEGVQPGQTLWLGLLITHQPEWHTYWKNAGDSGLATELNWQLPAA